MYKRQVPVKPELIDAKMPKTTAMNTVNKKPKSEAQPSGKPVEVETVKSVIVPTKPVAVETKVVVVPNTPVAVSTKKATVTTDTVPLVTVPKVVSPRPEQPKAVKVPEKAEQPKVVVKPVQKKPTTPAETVVDATNSVQLSCPSGMRLLRTKRFPKGSVSKGKIKGQTAVELAKSGGAYCVDTYEYPGRGQRPKTKVTRTTAAALCKRADKRLCTGSEWRSACTGRGGAVFPYGKSFNADKCVTEDDDGEERGVTASGAFRRCRSASGAYDMVGNVGEWTVDGRVRGGDVASSDEDASCSASEARSPSYSGGRVGFRCCIDFREE